MWEKPRQMPLANLIRADKLKTQLGMASVAANLEAKYEGDYAAIMQGDKK